MSRITFDKKARMFILAALDMYVNPEGFIIDLNTKEEVLARDEEHVHIDEFVGVCKGFGLVREGLGDIIALSDYMKEQDRIKEKPNEWKCPKCGKINKNKYIEYTPPPVQPANNNTFGGEVPLETIGRMVSIDFSSLKCECGYDSFPIKTNDDKAEG